MPTTHTEWGGGASGDEDYTFEAFVAAETTLSGHLAEQLSVAFTAPAQRMIGQYLIDFVDEAGYLPPDLRRGRSAFGGSGASPHQAADRFGGALRDPVGRHHRGTLARLEH